MGKDFSVGQNVFFINRYGKIEGGVVRALGDINGEKYASEVDRGFGLYIAVKLSECFRTADECMAAHKEMCDTQVEKYKREMASLPDLFEFATQHCLDKKRFYASLFFFSLKVWHIFNTKKIRKKGGKDTMLDKFKIKDFNVGDEVYFFRMYDEAKEDYIFNGKIDEIVEDVRGGSAAVRFNIGSRFFVCYPYLLYCYRSEEECWEALKRLSAVEHFGSNVIDIAAYPLSFCLKIDDQNVDHEMLGLYLDKVEALFGFNMDIYDVKFWEDFEEECCERDTKEERKEKFKKAMKTIPHFFAFPLWHCIKRDNPNTDEAALEAYMERSAELFGERYSADAYLTLDC